MPNRHSIDEIQKDKYYVGFGFPTSGRKQDVVRLGYKDKVTERGYRAFALQSEMYSDRTEIDVAMQCFEYAGPDEDLDGPLLGESGREDDLRGCDLDSERKVEKTAKKAAGRLALVLWMPSSDEPGVLRRLPRELGNEVYKHAFPRNFWQCYHTRNDDLTLLNITQSNPVPAIMRVSGTVRQEVLDSAFRERACKMIIGSEVIAINFPLVAGMKPGQALNASRARIPPSTDLFIGIQQKGFQYSATHRQRNAIDIAATRINVKRVVGLLNAIGDQWHHHRDVKIPYIRVSFKTNEDTSKLEYCRNDFELLIGPFYRLQLRPQCSRYLYGKPATIDRLHPFDTTRDKRNETCNRIMFSMSNPIRQDALLTYR